MTRFLTKLLMAFIVLLSANVRVSFAQTSTATTATTAGTTPAADATYPDKILACGYGNIDIYDITQGSPNLSWSFTTNASKGYVNCLPYNNNAQILAVSVWTGVDIVDTASKTITAHWDAVCGHDAVWLPNNMIMLARETCSTTNADGTSTSHPGGIDIFDGTRNGSAPLYTMPWGGAHFIVQNNDRDNTFWVTNNPHLTLMSTFNIQAGVPFIAVNKEFNPPSYDDKSTLHALTRSHDGKSMVFSSPSNVYSLDLTTHNVTPYQSTPITNAKSLDFDKNNGLLMWMSPDINTTTYSGVAFGDGSQINLPFPHYYRAFWYYGDVPASTATTTTTAATTNN